jgi:hypothetical protein
MALVLTVVRRVAAVALPAVLLGSLLTVPAQGGLAVGAIRYDDLVRGSGASTQFVLDPSTWSTANLTYRFVNYRTCSSTT